MVIAGWCRYLMAIDDEGNEFTPSPDPLYEQLHEYVKDLKLGDQDDDKINSALKPILSNKDIFGNDLYAIGLSDKIIADFKKMVSGKGAVRKTINETVNK